MRHSENEAAPFSREVDERPAPDPGRELPPEPPAEAAADSLNDEIRKLERERDDFKDRWMRSVAEADNARKRVQREMQDARIFATSEAVRPFLAVLDGFERAAAQRGEKEDARALRTGFDLLHRQLLEAARKVGLEPVAALDQPFDPHLHEAIEMIDTESAPEGTVVEELQRGYRLKDRLIRPAMVKVARRAQ